MVRTYLNRFSMQGGSVIDIKVHPNVPAGTILMTTKALPYPHAGKIEAAVTAAVPVNL